MQPVNLVPLLKKYSLTFHKIFHKYRVHIYLWNYGKDNPSLWLSSIVSFSNWVSIRWIAACALSDAKLLEGGVKQTKIFK